MKVSIDGILSTAKKMNSHNHIGDESLQGKKEKISGDTVDISKRIYTRLLTIQKELNNIQSSLTKNQIIKEGIDQLTEDSRNGGKNQKSILNDLKFEESRVLYEFIGDKPDSAALSAGLKTIIRKIEGDTSVIKRLQIEVENILASNLAGSGSQDVLKGINNVISKTDSSLLNRMSDLKSETVMSLIN